MSDRKFGIKGPRLRNMTDLLCVVTIVSWQMLVEPIFTKKSEGMQQWVSAKGGNSHVAQAGLNMWLCKVRNLECRKSGI